MSTSARYWREIPQRYRYEAGRCVGCGEVSFPPRVACKSCGGREFETVEIAGKGKLLTYTVIRVGPSQFSDQTPYAVGIAELDDGVRLTAQVADCDFDELKVGMPVKLEFRKIRDEGEAGIICYGYKFVPVR
ncbi:MAG: Zn-ribbon domain-containing OB-fold protein [Candidatus Eisenbacteria bacterium]|nr:Zn-ribbon domain-containing OB-fold protein [Candidatus Eisenbacteria bacterium]